MRAIETHEVQEARKKRRRTILSILMIVILMGSTAGYAISLFTEDTQTPPTSDTPYYNGVSWIVPASGRLFALQGSPDDVQNVTLEGTFSASQYQGKTVYIAAASPTIVQEIGGVVAAFAQRVQEACYSDCESSTLPQKDCSSTMIVWIPSETRRVYTNASCTVIEGDYVAVDALLYKILGY